MPRRQRSHFKGGTHPVYWRTVPNNLFSCLILRVPLQCHLLLCCGRFRERYSAWSHDNLAAERYMEATPESSAHRPTSFHRVHRNIVTSSFFSIRVPAQATDYMNFLQRGTLAPEFKGSTKPSTWDETKSSLALGQNTVHARRLPSADLHAQYSQTGWLSKGRSYRSEKSRAGTALTKKNLICHEYYVWGHVVPKSLLPLREQKQMIANYETLSPAERAALPAPSYLRSKQLSCFLEQDKSPGATKATPRSKSTVPSEQKYRSGKALYQSFY